ncbi:MAG TPA: PAS domain-containing protein [Candidatus Acidoferrum sp.]|nr:PAS domain-containing protein [Candidatus Acidoferrum sp.]
MSKAVLVSAPAGILVFDTAGRIVLVNAQTEELFAYGLDELLSRSVEQLLPELFREDRLQQTAASTGTSEWQCGPASFELRGLRKDGKELPLEISLVPLDTPDGPLVCCMIRTMASRGQAEQAVRDTEERFRLMVENSHDIMTIRNADGKVRYMSPSVHRVLGYSQEQLIGSIGLELVHPEDRSEVESVLSEFWKNPGARDSIQYRAKHANGTWVSLEVVAYNLLDHPAIRGVVLNGRDISQRKQDEASKDQMIAELQQTLANAKTLTGVLAICASCKKIQECENWRQIEAYIRDRSQVEFSHTMCPECSALWYPEHERN